MTSPDYIYHPESQRHREWGRFYFQHDPNSKLFYLFLFGYQIAEFSPWACLWMFGGNILHQVSFFIRTFVFCCVGLLFFSPNALVNDFQFTLFCQGRLYVPRGLKRLLVQLQPCSLTITIVFQQLNYEPFQWKWLTHCLLRNLTNPRLLELGAAFLSCCLWKSSFLCIWIGSQGSDFIA